MIQLIREVQDLFDTFKKFLYAILVGYGSYLLFEQYGPYTTASIIVSVLVLFTFYVVERFEELLEDMDRLRVTQLSWIAESGGDLNAESSDYE
jgi:hypothetical protein